ncbi:HNH endonuclease [Sphingomonas sp. A2-49]|uniref:HNH endonuclease n=1 Tax=Sphingomonas sp. A2-49 TaxID=1391375 RepID=UPI0039777C6D
MENPVKLTRRHPLRYPPYSLVRFFKVSGDTPLYKASPAGKPRSARNALEEAAKLHGKFTCYYGVKCREPGANRMPTIDHLVAQAKSGSEGLCNLRMACHACNSDKRDQDARRYRLRNRIPRRTKRY